MPEHFRHHEDHHSGEDRAAWCEIPRQICRAADDALLAFLPLSVVGHLVEARGHLADAGTRFCELERGRAAEVLRRAEALHRDARGKTSGA